MFRKAVILSSLFVALLGAGCRSTPISQGLASGVVGCSPREIEINDEQATVGGLHTFEASCKGKKHFCTYHATTGISCKEAKKQREEDDE